MNAHPSRQITTGSQSAAHLSALEAAHKQVETCVSEFEAIIAGTLSDVGKFMSARLRLRQANSGRTKVVLNASRYLIGTGDPHPPLLELQQRVLDQSQSISKHVQFWDVQSIHNDWDGYSRATSQILRAVHELVALEKRLLCWPLREGLRR